MQRGEIGVRGAAAEPVLSGPGGLAVLFLLRDCAGEGEERVGSRNDVVRPAAFARRFGDVYGWVGKISEKQSAEKKKIYIYIYIYIKEK